MQTPKPVVLCILDGWGIGPSLAGNAPALAHTPNFDRLIATCPHAELVTFGPDVGLPTGQMGNSEVGHTNIGAGRIVAMDLGQIDLAVETGTFAQEPALLAFIDQLKATGGTAHLLGVISDGGVHGHISHVLAAARILRDAGLPVTVHAITDGRDVAPDSAAHFMAQFVEALPAGAKIGTVIGRYYALDRDNRWERVSTAFDAIAFGTGIASAPDAQTAVTQSYIAEVMDEFIPATVIADYTGIAAGDGLFCLNFRADRAREILEAFANPSFQGFERKADVPLASILGMVEYSARHNEWLSTVFPKRNLPNTLGEWVSKAGRTQFRLAETEKYPHVTFFLNGGVETPYPGEERFMPASPKVATYDLAPEMASDEVGDAFVAAIEKGYDLIVTNFANPDMVGHTGSLEAAIASCEAVDRQLGRVIAALEAAGGAMVITADHGNCEQMIDPETGGPHTAHTLNPVPVALFGGPQGAQLRSGRLADVAPTVLDLLGLALPEDMTGESLICR